MGMGKHQIEQYKHYKIFIVSGITPALFIAEKDDPSKGSTLTADNLEDLKKMIDEKLDFAASININIWQGPAINTVFQNPNVQIKINGFNHDGFAIVINCDYDIDELISFIGKRCIRISKKHRRRNRRLNLAKFYKKYDIHNR